MKKLLIVSFCLLFVLSSLAMARTAKKWNPRAGYARQAVNPTASDVSIDGLFSAAQADTYVLLDDSFDSGGQCVPEGWYVVDLFEQPTTPQFHVDNYRVMSGSQSLWCGHRASTDEPWCNSATLPGYANNWNQFFTSKAWAAAGDVTVSYECRYDSEPQYDYSYVEYIDTSGGWATLYTFNGPQDDSVCVAIIPKDELPGTIKLRFHFQSDGAASDIDGWYDSQGAIIVDDITVQDTVGVLDNETFEDESIGDTQTKDGDWVASYGPGFGDYSGLFPGASVLQEDLCTYDPTCLWGFFNNSPDVYDCVWPAHLEQKVVPYGPDENGLYLFNEMWSPWIDLTGGGTVPTTASGVTFEFYSYMDNPVDNLVFAVWHIRTKNGVSGCPGWWKDRYRVYYNLTLASWGRNAYTVGDLITAGDNYAQLALGCWDYCMYVCGIYHMGVCHSHGPLFDRVKFYRIDSQGPLFLAMDSDLFQDNFPTDGTTTGTVRTDIAWDTKRVNSPVITPGDSVYTDCSEPNFGLGTASDGRAAIYCYVKCTTPARNVPQGMQAQEPGLHTVYRFPWDGGAATAGGFHRFQMDTAYTSLQGIPDPGKYCFDLNDDYFRPPDQVLFYFSATDAGSPPTTIYWSQLVAGDGHTLTQSEAETYPMEMQCLPTGNSDILYVDDASGYGVQPYFDTAFQALGITPDRYDTRAPGSGMGNGLGARAQDAQIIDIYHKIIWSSGNMNTAIIGDQTYVNDKSPDALRLFNFLDQSSVWNPGLYITGDNAAQELATRGSADYITLMTYINFNLLSGDHVAYGLAVSPKVIGLMPNTIFQHTGTPNYPDTMIAYGGCPAINNSDVLEPAGSNGAMEMYYDPDVTAGAVVSDWHLNAHNMTARVILEGFSYHYIRDDRPVFPPDRVDHLLHIIRWFENTVDDPTSAGNVPLANALYQNYPNPFNPQTTIKFSIRENAHVSLKIYNVAGQLVKTLKNEVLPANVYTELWDGLDNRGQPVASGIYFYKLVTKGFKQTKKMVLLK